jgi:tryptophan synthase alpha chain
MSEFTGAKAITTAITGSTGPAICAYLTAGYPDQQTFVEILRSVAAAADVIEVGIPFTDPMADGLTIQRASHLALENGTSLKGILELLESEGPGLGVPYLLMGYYNPFLAFGLDGLGSALGNAGVSGVIVPDLPFEEAAPMAGALGELNTALVQLVTPSTPVSRLETLTKASSGFVYAVTVKGVTGGQAGLQSSELDYLHRVAAVSELPVLAGFGIRSAVDVAILAPIVDGVVVGSALIEKIDAGEDPARFVESLRPVGALS